MKRCAWNVFFLLGILAKGSTACAVQPSILLQTPTFTMYAPPGNIGYLASLGVAGDVTGDGTPDLGDSNGIFNAADCGLANPPSWCSGSDIGAWINAAVAAGAQTIFIPDGTYGWSTSVKITQSGSQRLTIECSSRSATLNYTGSGDAVYWTSTGSPLTQLNLENCTLNGSEAQPGANGIHAYYAQNMRMTNVILEGFPADNFLGQGLIGATLLGDDILQAGQWNLKLEPDTAHSFASNANRIISGSLQYGGSGNFWDAGISSGYGSDTQNGLIGAVMEMSANVPQFVIEGTWDDYIENSYIEYINFPTSTGNLYSGWVGNYAGSGVGSGSTYTATSFVFRGNYLITPRAASSFTTASLFVANSSNLTVQSITDEGAPTYGISFYSSGSNSAPFSSQLHVGWQAALYKNPPATGWLIQNPGQAVAPGQYQWTSTGPIFGGNSRAGNVTVTGAASSGCSGITFGSTTVGAASCGSLSGAAGCRVECIGGVLHYEPYW